MTKSVKKKQEEALAKQEEALAREKEALARAKEEVKKLKGLLLERDKDLEQKHQEKLKLEKSVHETMCLNAKEYKAEQILTKALTKEQQELEKVYGLIECYKIDANAMRKERDNALKLVQEMTTTKQIESFICPISQASPYNLKLRKEAEEALARVEVEKLLFECFEDKQDKSLVKALVQKMKETEYVLAIEREELERVKCKLETFKIKHELVKGHVQAMQALAKEKQEFESKYKGELILKEALMKEIQVLESKYKSELILKEALDADAMRKARDNAIKLVNEIKTTKQVEWFICPISQDVMKDPHFAADGYTYEAEAIMRWLNTHDTSPMTNLKLPHRNLVPNRALRSAIQELV